MSRKICFLIYIIAVVTILISHILNFRPVLREVENVYEQMGNIYIALSSIILSFMLLKQKHSFLIQLGISFVVASIVQVFIAHSPLISVGLLYKAIAYMVYYYLTFQIRFML